MIWWWSGVSMLRKVLNLGCNDTIYESVEQLVILRDLVQPAYLFSPTATSNPGTLKVKTFENLTVLRSVGDT